MVVLEASFSDITDLRGIEFAINLTTLYIRNNSISDVSPLSSLTNLTALWLQGNHITDISPLSNLTNLTVLGLYNNNISDIFPLITLANLERLHLWGNNISDISPLSNLTNLTVLDLQGNHITDISPLLNLTNLTELYLGSNSISDILPLARLTNLKILYLWSNSISDISAVASLTNLTRLDLWDNTISNIFPLIGLTNLTSLHLWENNISDISAVASLRNLRYLSLGGNNISDISAVVNLTHLTHLHVPGNNISDIETIERLIARGTVVYFRDNPAFETPGPKIEDGWVGLIVPATGVRNGSDAAASGRDFLAEASDGTLTEADVAFNGASAGTHVGDSVWLSATLNAADPNNIGTLARDYILARGIDYPVVYAVVPIQSETPQQTRVYIGGGPVKVWLNGTLVYKDTDPRNGGVYETAVPVRLNAGNNLLFIAAYRQYPWTDRWGAFFGFQDGTGYTVGAPAPSAGNLDVNGDGQVNVIDLAVVALFYGTQVPEGLSLPADVNADGIVNILDLTAVAHGIDTQESTNGLSLIEVEAALAAAAELDGVAEAPTGFRNPSQHLRRITYHNVATALADAEHLGYSVHAVLKELLQLLTEMAEVPETTALLPNYPNPFNPETWIPYRLSKDAAVMLTIHDVRGALVRELTLGHQSAGVYESRARAAYWDGKNQLGEQVASGIYFYTLTAGEFTATRKMLVAK